MSHATTSGTAHTVMVLIREAASQEEPTMQATRLSEQLPAESTSYSNQRRHRYEEYTT